MKRLWHDMQRRRTPTAEVASEHEVENKEAVLVVLECVAHIDDEGMVDLGRRRSVEIRKLRRGMAHLLQ